ncbi:uroporphyrinogen-III synthase [Parasphingopyxis sp. CP4]|uniref:uroporphyrinogen-III synthase n=1 Tax=Parasphingopyxis sp. CP4 TaxID=2724527 RepID=UPI0015A343ED|nr:uroporphyrinogen-III synthase [Parasphingopyxis sp. CP4]QLC22743.1 uroporphyrinogen-III synthase [Parasphingopyxis sp. CP4]
MTSDLLVLRPEPGASHTAQRAREAGWNPVLLPLFTLTSCPWTAPSAESFDAVMMTSANAALFGGEGLTDFCDLPLYAVGTATGVAAKEAGFVEIIAGSGGVAELADRMRGDGVARIFHPAGAATRPFDESGLTITRATVYDAKRVPPPNLAAHLRPDMVILVHSPRAAEYLDALCTEQAVERSALRLVAISAAALERAGTGWGMAMAAAQPNEPAMLAAASALGESDPIR